MELTEIFKPFLQYKTPEDLNYFLLYDNYILGWKRFGHLCVTFSTEDKFNETTQYLNDYLSKDEQNELLKGINTQNYIPNFLTKHTSEQYILQKPTFIPIDKGIWRYIFICKINNNYNCIMFEGKEFYKYPID